MDINSTSKILHKNSNLFYNSENNSIYISDNKNIAPKFYENSSNNVNLYFNNKKISLGKYNVVLGNNKVYIPVKPYFEFFNYEVICGDGVYIQQKGKSAST